ncbi:hypothetical protein HanHA300_Chr07g0241981 [Helianthus annuus]|nr:hypothetical protein HanHA300_Chr07g0241981 [Helianthus annuus]KAJ0563091.1 hypothetical protein HanHA89_Chr07g0259171 [Helianthus annuus]KAJ0728463.1 hypothetical protein HanLR1_Chr07g0241901 [Helianthus annuus]
MNYHPNPHRPVTKLAHIATYRKNEWFEQQHIFTIWRNGHPVGSKQPNETQVHQDLGTMTHHLKMPMGLDPVKVSTRLALSRCIICTAADG